MAELEPDPRVGFLIVFFVVILVIVIIWKYMREKKMKLQMYEEHMRRQGKFLLYNNCIATVFSVINKTNH